MKDLDRRRFLQAGGAVALGATLALGAQPLPAAAERKRPIRMACGLGMCSAGANVREKFEIIARAGFEGVELDRPDATPLAEVLAARDATKLAICGVVDSVHWRKTLGDPSEEVRKEGLSGLEAALRDCAALGGTSVLLVPAVVNKKIAYDQAYARSQEAIKRALPLAAELKVKIAIENVWNDFLLSPLEAARYVDELQSPWAAWHLDLGNIVNYAQPEQWVRILGKRLHKLHFKDYSRKRRDEEGRWKGFDVKLGEGDVDWPEAMRALDEVGFEGWAAAEVDGGDEAQLRDVRERMERLLAS